MYPLVICYNGVQWPIEIADLPFAKMENVSSSQSVSLPDGMIFMGLKPKKGTGSPCVGFPASVYSSCPCVGGLGLAAILGSQAENVRSIVKGDISWGCL